MTEEEPNIWPEGHFTSVMPLPTQHMFITRCKCGWSVKSHTNASAWRRSTAHREYAVKERLEAIRQSIRAENISYSEIAELQSLAQYIEPGDHELAAWAGDTEA